MGWSTLTADLNLGTDKQGFGFGGTGKKSNNRQFDTYGEPFTMHDVVGCYLDLDNGMLLIVKLHKILLVLLNNQGSLFLTCVIEMHDFLA